MEFKDLIKKVLRYNKDSNITLLEKAYRLSEKYLQDKKRKNNRLWIEHYLDVAYILSDLKVDDNTLAVALMHGLINKGIKKYEIEKNFNPEIAEILEGIDKISTLKKTLKKRNFEDEALRKVLLVASKDIRVVIIKICDKLANMRELAHLDDEEKIRVSKEARDIYAPFAYRLGMSKIKSELEDLAFKYLEPEKYKEIEEKIKIKRDFGETRIFKVKKIIEDELKKKGIVFEVSGRVKSIYGIYKKTFTRDYNLDEITDIVGLRIIINSIETCYEVLGIVHNVLRPVPGKFKDYIGTPKPNGYQSLHTTVFDNEGKLIEIQIRTHDMHNLAEEGFAAHFKYKGNKEDAGFDKILGWLKELVHEENIENIDVDFFSDYIFVFTPKGKEIQLPIGSTVLDFAYAVHSDIGNHATAANINGKFSNLKTILDNGDTIEIITAKTHMPAREWVKFVRTSKARNKIKQALRNLGKVSVATYSNIIEDKKNVSEGFIYVEGYKNAKIKLASCCSPLPSDNIIAVKFGLERFNIHKENCEEVKKATKEKSKANWKSPKYSDIEVVVEALDRPGLFAEILNNIASMKININNTKGRSIGSGLAECRFSIKIDDLNILIAITERIKKIQGIKKVYLGSI